MDTPADSPKTKRGRPRFVPTDDQRQSVIELAGTLVPHETIARVLGLALNTLKRYFKAELAYGKEHLVASLKRQIVKQALNGSLRASCWLVERLDPAFAPPKRAEEPEAQTKYIIVKNGLPDIDTLPNAENNWGMGPPKANGEDVHEDGGAPSPSVIDRAIGDDPN